MADNLGRLFIPAAIIGGAFAAPHLMSKLTGADVEGIATGLGGELGDFAAFAGSPEGAGLVSPVKQPAATPLKESLENFALAAYGGSLAGDMLGLNQPRQPFQMASAQAPSPVVSPGGSFTPTAKTSMEALMQQMAQRRAAQGRIRFV